jgi:hypothetical protein
MSRFRLEDFPLLETSPTSAAMLRAKLGEMLTSSTSARIHVESMDPKTGEYKVVVHGTLDTEETPFEVE